MEARMLCQRKRAGAGVKDDRRAVIASHLSMARLKKLFSWRER
jgi:hypothetical protein